MEEKHLRKTSTNTRRIERQLLQLDSIYTLVLSNPRYIYSFHDVVDTILSIIAPELSENRNNNGEQLKRAEEIKLDTKQAIQHHQEAYNPNIPPLTYDPRRQQAIETQQIQHLSESRRLLRKVHQDIGLLLDYLDVTTIE